MSYLPIIDSQHVPLFSGSIWYVDKVGGDDTNDGESPSTAFETIGAAITAMADGDAVQVKAGTYTEVGLDLSNDAAEIWFEIGAVIDPASGTALTISGDHCKLLGDVNISPAAGATGLLVSGAYCNINLHEGATVLAGAIGILVTGAGCSIRNAACGFQTTYGYSLQGAQARLYDCSTVGNAATTGYRINGGADTGVLRNCTSAGHQTSGFYIDTGSKDWTVLDCSSGAGDGPRVDVDDANVWSNYSFADRLHNVVTLTGGVTTHNLYKVTGAVKIKSIVGIISTVIPGVASTIYLQAFSAGGTDDITDAPGVDIDAAPVGTLLVRVADSTVALTLQTSAAPGIVESTSFRDTGPEFILQADVGNDTYIRSVLSVAQASGAIHWDVVYEPLSDNGFLEPA